MKYEELIIKGKQLVKDGKLEEAVVCYEEAFNEKIIVADYIMLGYIYIDLGKYAQALEIFDELMKDYQTDEVFYGLASIYEKTNRIDEAILMYKKTLAFNPSFAEGYFALGYIFDGLSEEDDKYLSDALNYYLKTIEYDPNHYWAYLNLGSIYERTNIDQKALEYFLKAYEIDKTQKMICYNLGVIYNKLGNKDKAIQYYLEELQKEVPFEATYYNLGIIYKELKQYKEAQYYYLKGLSVNKDNYDIWYNLACLHVLKGDYENAYECFLYLKYKNKKYVNYIATDSEIEEFKESEYYTKLKDL